MPAVCGIINCGNRSNRDRKSFYRLPAVLTRGSDSKIRLNKERREKWLLAIKRADLNEEKASWLRVCQDHFVTGKPSSLEDGNHPDWVPSKNLGYKKECSASSYSRYLRTQVRSDIIASQVNVDDIEEIIVDGEEGMDASDDSEEMDVGSDYSCEISIQTDEVKTVSVCVQTDITDTCLTKLHFAYEDAIEKLNVANQKIKKLSFNEEDFENDGDKTKYYSGLVGFKTLMIVFNIVLPYIHATPTTALSKFQQFMLTLMHLRLNLDFTDLAYRFGISKATASRVFYSCLFIMHERLNRFILWPERSALVAKTPEAFLLAFGRKVTIVIDCFEIFIQKAPNVLAAAQTYSHYKHHNTVKYLIGISPQGVITFLSSGWGGRASDKFVVQNCGILEKLLPGDLILADRGFDVNDEVRLYCAEIQVPAFTKGKQQLSPLEIEKTRELAHVRIHVERVIGVLRQKYRILHNIMPISLVKKSTLNGLSAIDQIVTVCCCLTNISPSVVPFD